MRKYFIGTSGWNYKHWKKSFYPEKMPQKDWLKFYSEKFDTVEINNSFYGTPSEKTIKNWKETAGKSFRFAYKASRYITHMKKLNIDEASFKMLYDNLSVLGKNCGPVLFQLPPKWMKNTGRFRDFVNRLSKKYKYIFEFRNDTWWDPGIYEIMEEKNISFCIYELGGIRSPDIVTADFVYIRLHGPGDKYKGSYTDDYLEKLAGEFKSYDEKVNEVYCYFDNDEKAFAPGNALTLKKFLQIK